MLSPKPWKTLTVVRLIAAVWFSVLIGSLLMEGVQYHPAKPQATRFYICLSGAFICLLASLLLVLIPWTLERFLQRVIALLILFYPGFFLAVFVARHAGPSGSSVLQMLAGVLSFQGAALVWVALFLRQEKLGWREAFGFNQCWSRAVLYGVLTACLFMPVGWTLQLGSAKTVEWAGKQVPRLGLKPEQQQAVQTLQMAANWQNRLALGLVTILLVPFAEELLFRGILYPWIKQVGFPRLALWGNALLFAAMHMNLVTFLPLTVLALVLTTLYERTENLLTPITAHALFNGMNFVLLYWLQEHAGNFQ